MNYQDWVTRVATLLEVPLGTNTASATPTTDVNFNNVIPACIDYVENRIQRELDLINTLVTDSTSSTTANKRTFTLPTDVGTFVVVQQIAVIVNGVRQAPAVPVSREFLDFAYPSETSLGTPRNPLYWTPYNGTSILIGPSTDQSYPCEILGTIRLNQMSSTNPSNFLTISLPDLYIAASMSWLAAYQRDYGASASDPQLAMSWETQYKTLRDGATVEEVRKKFSSVGRSSRMPSPLANQPG